MASNYGLLSIKIQNTLGLGHCSFSFIMAWVKSRWEKGWDNYKWKKDTIKFCEWGILQSQWNYPKSMGSFAFFQWCCQSQRDCRSLFLCCLWTPQHYFHASLWLFCFQEETKLQLIFFLTPSHLKITLFFICLNAIFRKEEVVWEVKFQKNKLLYSRLQS